MIEKISLQAGTGRWEVVINRGSEIMVADWRRRDSSLQELTLCQCNEKPLTLHVKKIL